jgi:Uma2 family endonuclease
MPQALLKPLSEEDYLADELRSAQRREFAYGTVFAMAGGSANHNRVAGNLYAQLLQSRDQHCRPFIADVKLRLDSGGLFYYPDVMLVCDPADTEAYFKTNPCMVAEVLSPSTELTDRREKWAAYQKLPALREYLLLAQDRAYIEVYQRVNVRQWGMTVLGAGDTLSLSCGQLELPVDDIYRAVDFSQAA